MKARGVLKQPRQRRTSPGRDNVEGFERGCLNAFIADFHDNAEQIGGRVEEFGLFPRGFEKNRTEIATISQQKREDETRESRTGTEVHQTAGGQWHEIQELRGIPDVAAPHLVQRTSRDEIVAGTPGLEKRDEPFQAFLCFT
ncbi:MAG TPA: hypothetical protein VGL35_14730 [Rhizomicrobium sp.]